MSKRKATTDIHPDARDGSPAASRFKIEDTSAHISNASKTGGCYTTTTPKFGNVDSESSGFRRLGDLGTPNVVKLPGNCPVMQRNAINSAPTKDSHPESSPLKTAITFGERDPAEMRSQCFLEDLAELNQTFADWINKCIKNDPTVILTRVFIDHQRKVQALFHEEKMNTEGLDNHMVLRAQEKILHLLKEAEEDVADDDSTSDDNEDSSNGGYLEDETPHLNGPLALEASRIIKTPSVVPSSSTFNPFLNNKVVNGIEPFTPPFQNTDKVNSGVKDLEPKSAEVVVAKPMNFGAFSFASACSEAAAKAAAVKEQESEEADDDNPPKVEFTPVQEEGAIFTKRCKIFFKKENGEGYEDRGIGNLFVKPVPSTNRHQLIVRSETSLGNLLVNVLLSPDIPIKKMGQKDVMLVMMPTPGSGIRVVMVRVKDGRDEVVELLLKYSTI